MRISCVVRAGEEVKDHYVSPLEGTVRRREALRVGWFFSCQCARCEDSGELGTNLSSLSCSGLTSRISSWETSISTTEPCDGVVTSLNILQENSDYKCRSCGTTFSSHLVRGVSEELSDMLAITDKSDVLSLEFLLEMYEKVLHRTNSIIHATIG